MKNCSNCANCEKAPSHPNYKDSFGWCHAVVPFNENFQVEDFNSVGDVRSKMLEHDDSKYQLCVLKNIV